MENPILETSSWIQLKVFMNIDREVSWREKLNCYYGILLLLRPVLINRQIIDTFFFSQYGPKDYVPEPDIMYIRRIESTPETQVSYIRIRIHPLEGRREEVILAATMALVEQPLILDFEVLNEYDTRGDLGYRYGRNDDETIDDEATINFVNYWDAGCRYILSVLNDSDIKQNVDVWGIPHLINNAVGSSLRLSFNWP
ncbi:hypothetical protein ACFL0D_07335 [Thermoproteota archaeon]